MLRCWDWIRVTEVRHCRCELVFLLAYCWDFHPRDVKHFARLSCWQNETRICCFHLLNPLLHADWVPPRQKISIQLPAAVQPMAYVLTIASTWEMIIRDGSLRESSFCHFRKYPYKHRTCEGKHHSLCFRETKGLSSFENIYEALGNSEIAQFPGRYI